MKKTAFFSHLHYLLIIFSFLFIGSAWAEDFTPITPAEKSLSEVESSPGSPAVILFNRASITFMDYPTQKSSRLEAKRRIKILSAEGVDSYGETSVNHSSRFRLKNLQARIVLASGEVISVPDSSIFTEEKSSQDQRYRTKIVYPKVEVGSILDLNYEIYWNDFMDLEPWLFASRIPTLESFIQYFIPDNLAIRKWSMPMMGINPVSTEEKVMNGLLLKAKASNIPAVPEEFANFPLVDLSPRYMVVPISVLVGGGYNPLMNSWGSTVELIDPQYVAARRKKRQAKSHAKTLVKGKANKQAMARVLYAFVRDEILAEGYPSVHQIDRKVDDVLQERRGTVAEKALLLQVMLDAVGIDSEIVWASDRSWGQVDLQLPNPAWFERVMLLVDLEGESVVLDPIDRALPFGGIAPDFQGMPAIIADTRKPKAIMLPRWPAMDNVRKASIDLEVVDSGGVHGGGTLHLTGLHNWVGRNRGLDHEKRLESWKDWLETTFDGFDVREIELEESEDERECDLKWSLELREEEILGDEISLIPSRPLTLTQMFDLPVNDRRTPVQLAFVDVDELDLTVKWPEGWRLVEMPDSRNVAFGQAGNFESSVQVNEDGRELVFRRRIETSRIAFNPGKDYLELRNLMGEAADSDQDLLVFLGP